MPIDSIVELPAQSPLTGKGRKSLDQERLKKACADFEAIFIQQILKSMRQTVIRSDLFGKGTERDIFESLLDQEWSKGLARRGMGLGNKLYRQMMKYGEANLFDSTQASQINKRR
jgi:flagellar protein FlgJ